MRKSIELAYDAEKLWNKAKLHAKMHMNLFRGRTVIANGHIKGGIHVSADQSGAVIYNNLIEGDFKPELADWLRDNGLDLSGDGSE